MTEHANLTGAELHEPKGVAAAAANTVYHADGAGSGSFKDNSEYLVVTMNDVSLVNTIYIPTPVAGTITKVTSVINGAIATADATITVKNSAGSSMGTITITQTGSAAGDVDTLSPTSNNTITADSFMTIETDGASTNTVTATFTITIKRS